MSVRSKKPSLRRCQKAKCPRPWVMIRLSSSGWKAEPESPSWSVCKWSWSKLFDPQEATLSRDIRDTYCHLAQQVTPLPLPDRQDALATAVHGQYVATSVLEDTNRNLSCDGATLYLVRWRYQLREGDGGDASVQLAHAKDVECLQRFGAPDAHMRLWLAIPSCLLTRCNQLPWRMHIHAE